MIRKDCRPRLGVQEACVRPTDPVRSEGQGSGLGDDVGIRLHLDREEADGTK